MQRLAQLYHQLHRKDHTHKKARKSEKEKMTKDHECTGEQYSIESEDNHHCRARTFKKRRTRSAG